MNVHALPKLIAIVGPTASGKSGIAEVLAQTFNGEIVSADSRQLYRGLDIGTAKDPGEWKRINGDTRYVLESGVIEHLVDILDPDQEFTAAEYQHRAFEAIGEILARGRVPFLVGGTQSCENVCKKSRLWNCKTRMRRAIQSARSPLMRTTNFVSFAQLRCVWWRKNRFQSFEKMANRNMTFCSWGLSCIARLCIST